MTKIRLITDARMDPAENMKKDLEIAQEVCAGQSPETLRVYGWNRPALSLGRRQKLEQLPSDLAGSGRVIVRRPTGGGAVLHDTDEFTYALSLPRASFQDRMKPSDIPARIHRALKEKIQKQKLLSLEGLECASANSVLSSEFCFQSPVYGDLLIKNRKVAGSAMRVWRGGLLIQGSIQGLPVAREALLESLAAVVDRFLTPVR
jgi:lipoyl(octanoyl) transferase